MGVIKYFRLVLDFAPGLFGGNIKKSMFSPVNHMIW